VVVVEAEPEARLRRLERRGLAADEARSRIAIQATDERRRAVADELLHNNGSRAELAVQVDALWQRLAERAAVTAQ
jgi:dephospho-CoA kinase